MTTAENTAARLYRYFDFDEQVVSAVSETAAWQNRLSLGQLASRYGLNDSRQFIPGDSKHNPVEILEVFPDTKNAAYDEESALVVPTTYGTSITDRTRLRTMRLLGVMEALGSITDQPTKRVIVVGSPASPGRHIGKLTPAQIAEVWTTGDLRPMAEPALGYLERARIHRMDLAGYSAAAEKAAVMARYATIYGQTVNRVSLVESAAVVPRSFYSLLMAFRSTMGPEDDYIGQTHSRPYQEACAGNTRMDTLKYKAGLFRASNLALASVLKKDGHERRVRDILERHPDSHVRLGWGTASELTDNQVMLDITRRAIRTFGRSRLDAMPLRGMHHAGIEDLDLFAAMMLPAPWAEVAQIPTQQHSADLGRVA